MKESAQGPSGQLMPVSAYSGQCLLGTAPVFHLNTPCDRAVPRCLECEGPKTPGTGVLLGLLVLTKISPGYHQWQEAAWSMCP